MSSEKFNILKEKFLQLSFAEKSLVIETLHKIHLGLADDKDFLFLGDILDLAKKNLHSEAAQVLSRFLLDENEVNLSGLELQDLDLQDTKSDLPVFDPDEVQTLRDDIKPLK